MYIISCYSDTSYLGITATIQCYEELLVAENYFREQVKDLKKHLIQEWYELEDIDEDMELINTNTQFKYHDWCSQYYFIQIVHMEDTGFINIHY